MGRSGVLWNLHEILQSGNTREKWNKKTAILEFDEVPSFDFTSGMYFFKNCNHA